MTIDHDKLTRIDPPLRVHFSDCDGEIIYRNGADFIVRLDDGRLINLPGDCAAQLLRDEE